MRELRYNRALGRWEWRVDGKLIFSFESASEEDLAYWRKFLARPTTR